VLIDYALFCAGGLVSVNGTSFTQVASVAIVGGSGGTISLHSVRRELRRLFAAARLVDGSGGVAFGLTPVS
jgi:hypothetical protein